MSCVEQQGAALVVVIAIGAVAAVAWQQRASLSQLLMAQQVLDQSAQAASLAAAQHHARLLNAHAFLNRTLMAHQVAMAHLLTLASAEKMRREMSRQVVRGNPPAYLIGMMFGPQHAAAYAASKLSSAGASLSGVDMLHRAFKQHDDMLWRDFRQARKELLANIGSTTKQIVHDVLKRNMVIQDDAKFDLTVDVKFSERSLIARSMSSRDQRWRGWFDSVIKKHAYLDKRRKTAKNWWSVSKGCPHMRHHLRRRGESQFDVNGLWQSVDTLSFHAVRGHKIYLCYWREYPMGWANVVSKGSEQVSVSEHDSLYALKGAAPGNFKKVNFLTWIAAQYSLTTALYGFNNVLADGRGAHSQILWRAHHRLTPYVLDHQEPLITIVSVKQSLSSLRNPLLRLGLRVKGVLDVQRHWPKEIKSRSAAQAYFDRFESRADGQRERRNLFQPFWLARNVLEP